MRMFLRRRIFPEVTCAIPRWHLESSRVTHVAFHTEWLQKNTNWVCVDFMCYRGSKIFQMKNIYGKIVCIGWILEFSSLSPEALHNSLPLSSQKKTQGQNFITWVNRVSLKWILISKHHLPRCHVYLSEYLLKLEGALSQTHRDSYLDIAMLWVFSRLH